MGRLEHGYPTDAARLQKTYLRTGCLSIFTVPTSLINTALNSVPDQPSQLLYNVSSCRRTAEAIETFTRVLKRLDEEKEFGDSIDLVVYDSK